jgi:scyllo-inositol 2-dehydrogenase (NADP+)
MAQPVVSVAVVGLGWVALHRHLPTIAGDRRFRLVGVIDSRPGLAEATARRLGVRLFQQTSDLSEVRWLDQVDAVVIATSPFTHYQHAKAALSLGKHVLVEKPFALTVPEGEELLSLSKTHSAVLAIVHNFQFASSTRRLTADLASGTLGQIRAIVARQYGNPLRRLPEWYARLPLGLFYDESPHLLYLLRRLSPGPLTLLSSNVFPGTRGESTPALINAVYSCTTHTGTIPIALSMHFESPVSEWHVAVLGERYAADVDIFRDIYVRLKNDGVHGSFDVLRTSLDATWQHWSQHLSKGLLHVRGRLLYGNEEVYSRFYAAAVKRQPVEDISATDALDVLRMQHEILEQSAVAS